MLKSYKILFIVVISISHSHSMDCTELNDQCINMNLESVLDNIQENNIKDDNIQILKDGFLNKKKLMSEHDRRIDCDDLDISTIVNVSEDNESDDSILEICNDIKLKTEYHKRKNKKSQKSGNNTNHKVMKLKKINTKKSKKQNGIFPEEERYNTIENCIRLEEDEIELKKFNNNTKHKIKKLEKKQNFQLIQIEDINSIQNNIDSNINNELQNNDNIKMNDSTMIANWFNKLSI